MHLNPFAKALLDQEKGYLADERAHQLGEIARRMAPSAIRPQAPLEGRSVIVTDDAIPPVQR